MLLEFRVKNFRSLRDEQVLSLVASKDDTDTHTLTTGIKTVPKLLCSTVLYGANASGKSNLIKALQYMRSVVAESATVIQPGQRFNLQPFRLDSDSANQPTEFEITFILKGVRYQYGFAMTSERIISEHLLVYKTFKPQRWFERHFDTQTGKDVYEFSHFFKGPKNLWEGATRANSLFLSMAVQLNSEILRQVFDWFVNGLIIFNEQAPLNLQATIQMLKQSEEHKQICAFLNAAADISIADIEVVTEKIPAKTVHFDLVADKAEVQSKEIEQYKLLFHHVTEQGKAIFDWTEQSSGTRNLLFLAGHILAILNKGLTLVIDELDTSLHTLLMRQLVGLFHDSELNKGGAQLIFSTHNTSLLDTSLFRRDQVWFVEKDAGSASHVYPLSDFSPRKNEALARGYLIGRYGGVPFGVDNLGLSIHGTR